MAGCGAFIAAKQMHGKYPATFEWPTFFGAIRTLGWMVIVFLAADALLGSRVSQKRGPAESDDDDADATSSASPQNETATAP